MVIESAGLTPLRGHDSAGGSLSVVVVCVVRNESHRIEQFLAHYRSLGVTEFVFVDNESTDETLDVLMSDKSLSVYVAKRRYSQSNYGVDWVNSILDQFARGRWALVVDADEHLVYPKCERISLLGLCQYLAASGADCLKAFLLDMYADRPLASMPADCNEDVRETFCYFDVNSYHQRDSQGVPIRGGPRHRLFWSKTSGDQRSPVLIKFPLVKWSIGRRYLASTHQLNAGRSGDVTGALLHFKMTANFLERSELEVLRGEHWDSARQYRAYVDALTGDASMTAMYAGSRRLNSSSDLVECGLMFETVPYKCWTKSTLEDDGEVLA